MRDSRSNNSLIERLRVRRMKIRLKELLMNYPDVLAFNDEETDDRNNDGNENCTRSFPTTCGHSYHSRAMPYPTACYIDDVMLASPGEEQHFKHLSLLLQRMRETGLKLKVEKLEIFQRSYFLEHKLTREGIKACQDKIDKVNNFPVPKMWIRLDHS